MKKYSLGEAPLVKNFINGFNIKFQNMYVMQSVNGLTMNKSLDFTAVVDYYEIDNKENLDVYSILDDSQASISLSNDLNIPFFIIFYRYNTDYFDIYDYSEKTFFKKTIYTVDSQNEFITWWLELKGTSQVKIFYKAKEYKSWKINEVLESNGLKWGGDVDGVILDKEKNICLIVEFRKSSFKNVNSYDPAFYFRGTYNRNGDYQTWFPLIKLSKELEKKLVLITLSLIDVNRCGLAIIKDSDYNNLYYENELGPNKNVCNSFNEAYERLIEILKNSK